MQFLVFPALDSNFLPEIPYVDKEKNKDNSDAFDEENTTNGTGKEPKKTGLTAEKTEAPVKIAKPSEKLNDDVIIKTKTEINTKGEAKAETDSAAAAEKAIEEAKEEAAAKAEEKVKEVADTAIDSYVDRFLNGTNDKTKEKVMEYLKQFNITLGGGWTFRASPVLVCITCSITYICLLLQ